MPSLSLPPYLDGKQVLVTRARHQSAAMIDRIHAYGGEAITVPLIAYRRAPLADASRSAWLRDVEQADWLIFTSSNSLDFFMRVLDRRERLSQVKLAAVGKKTAERLKNYGLEADFIPDHFNARGIVTAFSTKKISAARVAVPLGSLSDTGWFEALRNQNIEVTGCVLYQTVANETNRDQLEETIRSRRLSAITFASPSAVRFFTYLLPEALWRSALTQCTVAVIGPATADAVKAFGYRPEVVPNQFTAIDLIDALANYYHKKGSLDNEQQS
ncbi:uroporphyrinogen-III synthase [Sporolactobacillus vineae]|uniref:uroporphyrinogen-III synthase n=1 Tax=Sporolactobacillus vineae TaxID=444463 RepID=UPI00028A2467|nr:uroporphyrinogen-III synthase [Sporolactobacillus vineae]